MHAVNGYSFPLLITDQHVSSPHVSAYSCWGFIAFSLMEREKRRKEEGSRAKGQMKADKKARDRYWSFIFMLCAQLLCDLQKNPPSDTAQYHQSVMFHKLICDESTLSPSVGLIYFYFCCSIQATACLNRAECNALCTVWLLNIVSLDTKTWLLPFQIFAETFCDIKLYCSCCKDLCLMSYGIFCR